jgi:mRNA deadenylase 3'-5' endonuclease subunit Ccr4
MMTKLISIRKSLHGKLQQYPEILERQFKVVDENYSPNQFRVMQWNMLAKALCQTQPDNDQIKTPAFVYDWDKYRLWRTLEELTRYKCDIICIEEVDRYEEIKPYLHAIG